jgi:hypothetical protein
MRFPWRVYSLALTSLVAWYAIATVQLVRSVHRDMRRP